MGPVDGFFELVQPNDEVGVFVAVGEFFYPQSSDVLDLTLFPVGFIVWVVVIS